MVLTNRNIGMVRLVLSISSAVHGSKVVSLCVGGGWLKDWMNFMIKISPGVSSSFYNALLQSRFLKRHILSLCQKKTAP